MPESRHLPPSPESAAAPFKKFLVWKLVGILVGGVAGAILGGNAIVWLREPAEVWRETFPSEGIIGAVGGVLLGGTLAGGRVGAFGASLLIGTATGLLLGYAFQSHYKSGLFVGGALVGLLTGFIVGLILEVMSSRSTASR